MSLHDCLQRAIDSGDLPPKRAREAQALFAERLAVHASAGPGAEALAAQDVWIALRQAHIRRKRQVLMQADTQMRLVDQVTRYVDSTGTQNAARAVRALVEWDQDATFQSVEGTRQALESLYLGGIGDFIADHSRHWATGQVRQKALLSEVVRELKGEASGNERAKNVAEAIRRQLEQARQHFNAAGGEIAKLEGYDLPHHWDRKRVSKITADQFAARFHDEMDWERMVDRATGQPFARSSREARVQLLKDIHRGIETGGWDKLEPGSVFRRASLGKSRADHRIMHFRTADGWLKANEEFGTADPFQAVIMHLKGMARDTAQMRVLGPNPRAGLEFARQTALKLAAERPWTPGKPIALPGAQAIGLPVYSTPTAEVNGIAAQASRMLDIVSGAANVAEMDLFASVMGGVRHGLVASQLGGAMLSAVSDVGFMGMAAHHVGMDPKKVLGRHLATLALPENRRQLARAGIISEGMASTGVAMSRMFGDAYGSAVMAHLSEFTLRASGLTAWTDIARGSFKLEFYGLLADNADRAWADIDAPLREHVFKARGITPEEWDIIRATPLAWATKDPTATFLLPREILARTDLLPEVALDVAVKLQSAIQEQVEFAVPSVSLRARATVEMGPPGSLGGEIQKSVFTYKNFAASLMFNQLGRVLYKKLRGNRFGTALAFGLITAAAGAVSIQLKELFALRDPRDMTEGRFWKAAMLQGGGLGIFGDFIYAAENRFGGGLPATVAGPVIGLLGNAATLTGKVGQALWSRSEHDRALAGRELVRFLNQYGGPTNLWYLNAAWDRAIWDGLQEWLDPEAQAAWNRKAKQRLKDYGNQSFLPQGAPLSAIRMPDFANAIGGSQ